MSPYFDVTFEVLLPVNPARAKTLAPKLIEAIQQHHQQYLPMVIWPEQAEDSAGIRITPTQNGVLATFTTEAESEEDIRKNSLVFSIRLKHAISDPDFGVTPEVRPTWSQRTGKMRVFQVIQKRAQTEESQDELYAVYDNGMAYQIPGNALLQELEDPDSHLFSSGQLRLLSRDETQAVQNFELRSGGPNYVPIWAVHGRYGGYQPGGAAEEFVYKNKDNVARTLAAYHREAEPSIQSIHRIVSENERSNASEPIKLLEVNADAIPAGIMPIYFGPGGDVNYPSVIVELTPEEYKDLQAGRLQLPQADWKVVEEEL